MKLHVNLPHYAKGFELNVMHVGSVKNGDTIELTDSQVVTMRDAGITIPEGEDIYLIPPQAEAAVEAPKTTDLPSIEDIAAAERKRQAPKPTTGGTK